MLKRGIFIFVMLTVMGNFCRGQELSHQVIIPYGSVVVLGEYGVSQTVGEPMVISLSTETRDLTQGFQQPSITITKPLPPQGKGVKVYPNPVVDLLTIELFGENQMEFEVTIFNINGSVFHRSNYICEADFWKFESINVSGFKSGMYYVRVRSLDNNILRLFKIDKM